VRTGNVTREGAGFRSLTERLFRVHPAVVSRLRTMHWQSAQPGPAELRIMEGCVANCAQVVVKGE